MGLMRAVWLKLLLHDLRYTWGFEKVQRFHKQAMLPEAKIAQHSTKKSLWLE
jgi:hypothetical protein